MIYANLLFDSISDNKYYFTGLFALLILNGFRCLANILGVRLSVIPQICLGLACVSLGYSIICYRFEHLKRKDINKLKNPREVAHYLALLKESLQNEYIAKAKMSRHK